MISRHSNAYIDQMRDRRDALLLHHGRGAEQRTRWHKQDIAEHALAHLVEDISAQHGRTAAAARSAGMNVLTLIKNHHAAITVTLTEIDALLLQQIPQQPRSDPSEVAGEDHVIIPYLTLRLAQIPKYGVRRSRC